MSEKLDLNEVMKKAQEMQQKMQEIQKQISDMKIVGRSGGGLVAVYMTGTHYAERVELDPAVLKEEKTVIEDLVAAAINDATDKIERGTKDKMMALSDIKLPAGMDGSNITGSGSAH